MRLVQARENRKCEYQNRYYDPKYFVHKIPRCRTNPVGGLHAPFMGIYAAIISFSGKDEDEEEFPKKLNFREPFYEEISRS